MRNTWDIFCCVIDNFGDIGVTWRLAQQLSREFDQDVRLWADDLATFGQLVPEANPNAISQNIQGITVNQWPNPWIPSTVADVVIEAFACQLPDPYIATLSQRKPKSLWLNLEYLSAEDWVNGCHGLPSPQLLGTKKYFFFPGFNPQTGGLLRENALIEERIAFQQNPGERALFLNQLGVKRIHNALLISLFSYKNSGLHDWLDTLSRSQRLVQLLIPAGAIVEDIRAWLKLPKTDTRNHHSRGALNLVFIPFLKQDEYDRLLWSCDLNLVRGEDSFVRAQWAGRSFIWHIYPQQDNIHLQKLEAFLTLYREGLSSHATKALIDLSQAWNTGQELSLNWKNFIDNLPELTQHAENWCQIQSENRNLAESLVEFHRNWLKYAP